MGLMMSIVGLQVASSMYLKGLVNRPDLDGRTVVRPHNGSLDFDHFMDGYRVHVLPLNDQDGSSTPQNLWSVKYTNLGDITDELDREIDNSLRSALMVKYFPALVDIMPPVWETSSLIRDLNEFKGDPRMILAVLDVLSNQQQLLRQRRLVTLLGKQLAEHATAEDARDRLTFVMENLGTHERQIIAEAFMEGFRS